MQLPAPRLRGTSISILRPTGSFSARIPVSGLQSLHIVIGGQVTLTSGGSRVTVASGELVLFRLAEQAQQGAAHASLVCEAQASPAPESVAVVSAGFAEASPASLPNTPVVHFGRTHVAADPALESLVSLLGRELATEATEQPRVLSNLMDVAWSYVARQLTPRGGLKNAPPRDARVTRALALIHSRPRERWTLQALAKASGLSRSAFVRRFRRDVGVSPLRYLTERRLHLAAELLVQTDESLAAIAAQVGYESEFAFSRAFKRHSGHAPGAFRRQALPRPSATLALAA